MSEFRQDSFDQEPSNEVAGPEAIVEMQEDSENLLDVIASQQQKIENSVESQADKNWIRKNNSRFALKMATIIGISVLPLIEGCGRHKETKKTNDDVPVVLKSEEPRRVVRDVETDNGFKIHIYSDSTYDVEQPESVEIAPIESLPHQEGPKEESEVEQEKKEVVKPAKKASPVKRTAEEIVAKRAEMHKKAEQARADLNRQTVPKKPEELSEDEKAFRKDSHPNTLRQRDFEERHRGPTY